MSSLSETRARVLVLLDELEHLLLVELGRREVSEVLVDPVRHERAGDARFPPRLLAHSCTQTQEMFQSSLTSWSSKIIAVGTVESSQRISGSDHDSR